ncbi:MAG: phenylacetic acid degradation b [Bacteroidota bacterium]|nr:phenylacetic acid degradation b [Bacteroidota bacterium]
MLESLDPRIKRIEFKEVQDDYVSKDTLDQFQTYQVFIQVKEGKPYEHVGIVHAPDLEFALVFAKEQFSRRPLCSGLWVAKTQDVKATPFVESDECIYDFIGPEFEEMPNKEHYEIFHLKKRGKQHVHQGSVLAGSYNESIVNAKVAFSSSPIVNAWVIKEADILQVQQNDKDIWSTLTEKKHRDITSYKAMDKIRGFNNL